MDETEPAGTFPAPMKTPPLAVAFREVRHFRPDDWLHCEPLALRGEAMDWTIPAHRHEGLHQFMFLARGRAEVRLDDRPQRLQAPALMMVAPGCVHGLRFQRRSAGHQVTVPSSRLEGALAQAPALAALLPVSRVVQGTALAGDADRVAAMFGALEQEFQHHAPGRAEALQAHLVLLVTWFLRRAVPVTADEGRRAMRDTLVQRYRGLVEIHLRRQQPLAFYAGTLGVTPDHLSRSCRAVTGQSALDLLHERLLLEARRLLAYTAAPVSEVARDLGFDDPSYFSRFFARRAGRSPLDWRAALQRGKVAPP